MKTVGRPVHRHGDLGLEGGARVLEVLPGLEAPREERPRLVGVHPPAVRQRVLVDRDDLLLLVVRPLDALVEGQLILTPAVRAVDEEPVDGLLGSEGAGNVEPGEAPLEVRTLRVESSGLRVDPPTEVEPVYEVEGPLLVVEVREEQRPPVGGSESVPLGPLSGVPAPGVGVRSPLVAALLLHLVSWVLRGHGGLHGRDLEASILAPPCLHRLAEHLEDLAVHLPFRRL